MSSTATLHSTARGAADPDPPGQEQEKLKQRFELAFSAAPSAMAIIDERDNIVAVNAAYTRLLGYTREDFPTLSKCFERLFPDPGYRARILSRWCGNVERARMNRAPVARIVGRIRRKDGVECVVEARTTMSGGERIVTLSDITDRVRAEVRGDLASSERDQLRSELNLQSERMPMALVVSEASDELIILDWNPAAERMFGYSREEVIGRSPYDIFVPPERKSHVQRAVRWPAGDDTVRVVNEARTKDGRTIWCEWFNTPMRDASGKVTRVIGMAQDITARMAAERQLRLWANVLSHSVEGIVICDREQRILQVNAAFERLTGYSREEVLGKTPRVLQSGRQDGAFYAAMWHTLLATGAWSGEVCNRRKSGELYLEWLSISTVYEESGQIAHFVGIFSDITERKAAEDRMTHLARFDALTNLPNRALLQDRLDQAIKVAQRSSERVGVAFIDLDRFKEVNDSLGHDAGDVLLRQLAERLTSAVRAGDTVARMGGDEFVLIFEHLHDEKDATRCATTLLEELRKPVILEGHEIIVTASIGIALFPEDAHDAQGLLRNADAAMYQAKADGRDRFHFYTEALHRRAIDLLSMENALRRALNRGEFTLHYQPQVDILTGKLVGAEALIRWNHPEKGLVMPSAFIPIAEERGLIKAIDEWVFAEVVRQIAAWDRSGLPRIPIALNISSVPFHDKDFLENVAGTIEGSGVGAERLELELTESVMMRNIETSAAVMQYLHEMGLHLSIDDFGTGYSSLNYLRRLPIDKIKVDQSFVKEMIVHADGTRIVSGIVGLAKSLRLQVIAEGVETEEQLELLRAHGCDQAQGFLFSRAVPVPEFERLIAAWEPRVGAHRGAVDVTMSGSDSKGLRVPVTCELRTCV